MPLFLGVDTSNYTTSLALCRDGKIIANLKLPVFVASGNRGTRQSDAVFSHTKNLPILFDQLRDQIGEKIEAVGVSATPRDAEGSYMPCFLTGVAAASAVSCTSGIPLYRFSHQRGHIYAALYSSGALQLCTGRFIAFHMSGGTSEVLMFDGENGGKIDIIGGTLDLTAGQLIDRTGVMLGIPFPCGAQLEKLAIGVKPMKAKISVKGFECNLSGGENKVSELIEKGASREDVAAYAIEFVRATLDRICENLRAEFGDIPMLFSGGVMSCSIIKESLGKKYGGYFAMPEFSCDNAAGIALLCEREYIESPLKNIQNNFHKQS